MFGLDSQWWSLLSIPVRWFLVEKAIGLQPLRFGRVEMLWRWQSDDAFAVCRATSDPCSRPWCFNHPRSISWQFHDSWQNIMILDYHRTSDFIVKSVYNLTIVAPRLPSCIIQVKPWGNGFNLWTRQIAWFKSKTCQSCWSPSTPSLNHTQVAPLFASHPPFSPFPRLLFRCLAQRMQCP